LDALDEIEAEVADGYGYQYAKWREYFVEMPSAQPEKCTDKRTETHACDLISRQAAIDALMVAVDDVGVLDAEDIETVFALLPSAQPEKCTDKRTGTHACDCISRQAAIDALDVLCQEHRYKIPGKAETYSQYNEAWQDALDRAEGVIGNLPTAQPERTCVNCGRTVNNGGWYADGRTRCPIEEHYALPKDGYCHLWEKRNVTDDDYPERREE